jgi:hypothetical protein
MSFYETENFSETSVELADRTLGEEVIDFTAFSLDENYLEKVANDQCRDADEASSTSDDNEDSTGLEVDVEDSDIEQKMVKV